MSLSIRYKFGWPVALMLIVVVLVVSWLFASSQSRDAEDAFHSHVETMATNSCAMMHMLAAEYTEAHGMRFNRVAVNLTSGDGAAEKLGLQAIQRLASDSTPTGETIASSIEAINRVTGETS